MTREIFPFIFGTSNLESSPDFDLIQKPIENKYLVNWNSCLKEIPSLFPSKIREKAKKLSKTSSWQIQES